MTTHRILPLAIVAISVTVALTGCVAAGAAPVVPSETSGPMPVDTGAALLDQIDDIKATIDDWRFRWLDESCDADSARPDKNATCVDLLVEGVGIAMDGNGIFDLVEAQGITGGDFEELAPVRSGFEYGAWRGGLWNDASCDTEVSDECAELTVGLVDDLEYTHEFLMLWSR